MRQTRREIMPGVFLTCLQTDKFKTGLLSLTLVTRLSRETASQNALIPSVLRRGTVQSPDMEALAARLDDLYGAHLEPAVRKRGEIQCVGFIADFVDDACLPAGETESLLEAMAALLGEVLLEPNTWGGLLLPQYVDSEREKLLEDIRARTNDKLSYSRMRLMELMCPGEDYAVDELGDEETASAIHYVGLTRHYKTLLAASPIELFYCGGADFDRVERAMADALVMLPRGEIDYDIGTDIRLNTVAGEPQVFTEDMDVAQAKLAVGYRLGEVMDDPDMAALGVMNALFGGGPTSKLFMNLREKQQLCYYVSSGIDLMKGVMTAAAGIDGDRYDEAVAEIGRQLQAVQAGDFTAGELQSAKAGLVSRLLAMADDPGDLESFWLCQSLLGLEYGPEELAALTEDVTAEDVVKAASTVACDAVYLLRGAGEDEDGED